MTAFAYKVHDRVLSECNGDTKAYYTQLDRLMRKEFPLRFLGTLSNASGRVFFTLRGIYGFSCYVLSFVIHEMIFYKAHRVYAIYMAVLFFSCSK